MLSKCHRELFTSGVILSNRSQKYGVNVERMESAELMKGVEKVSKKIYEACLYIRNIFDTSLEHS